MKNLFTVKEVSKKTGYAESYIRKLICLGTIKREPLKTRAIRITQDSINEWLGLGE